MSLEQITTRMLVRWGLCALAFLIVAVVFTFDSLAGLIPVALGFILLYVFRPPKAQLTDADLDALLGRA